jgi:hypothetical protein
LGKPAAIMVSGVGIADPALPRGLEHSLGFLVGDLAVKVTDTGAPEG